MPFRMSLARSLTLVVLTVACGGSDIPDTTDSGPTPDAPIVVMPDAPIGQPDAPTGQPDAPINPQPDAAISLTCGNGTLEPPEQCDDGNLDPLDGCSPMCVVEADCGAGVITISVGDTVTGSTAGLSNVTQGSCGGASSGEQIFQFTVYDTIGVTVSTDLPGTDYNTAIFVRSDCGNPGTQLGCASTGALGDVLSLTLAPGTYYVFVDGIAGATGNFELSVTTVPVVGLGDACDPAGVLNTCDTGLVCLDSGMGPVCTDPSAACVSLATPITPGTSATGDTSSAVDTFDTPCSPDASAGDLTFVVDVPPGGSRDLVVTGAPTNFAVDMFDIMITVVTVCGDETSNIACEDSPGASSTEVAVVGDIAPGSYYIVVDGYQGAGGAFQLDVVLRDNLGMGAVCDPAGILNTCVAPYSCVDDGTGTMTFTCQDPTVAICDGGTDASAGGTVTGTLTAGDPSALASTCTFGGPAPEHVYFVDLAAPAIISATNTTTMNSGSTLYLRGPGSCADSATIECDTNGGGGLTFTTDPLPAGRYYIVMDGSGTYSLDITISPTLATGATCDPASTTDRCGPGDWCLGTICSPVVFAADTPPNAAFCDAQGPFSSDFVVTPASMTGGSDVDTFLVDMPAGGTLHVDTTDGFGGCIPDTIVEVFDAAGMTCMELDAMPPMAIATDDDSGPGACSLLDVTGLAAGTYYVSVSYGGGATGAYVLVVDLP